MTTTELNEMIIAKLDIKPWELNNEPFGVRFDYRGSRYFVDINLMVEKVDGACLVTDSDARQLEKLLRGEQWDGNGLPPVGTECEVMDKDHDHIWHRCKILAHIVRKGLPCAVFESEPSVSCCSDRYFRPLRTERDKAIEQMVDFKINYHSYPKAAVEYLREMTALYDAIVAGKIDGLGKVG